MTNLLCFAFILRNAGIDDQLLVENLSEATAGSLTGLGHSSPYEELACYSLAVDYLFLSGPASNPARPLQVEPFSARDARSDYEIPWILRGLVDSMEIKDLFPDELRDLREGVASWKPTTKALKEIKKRVSDGILQVADIVQLEVMAGRGSKLRPGVYSNSTPGSPAARSTATVPSERPFETL